MVPALHCDSEATWQHGNSLVNYMKMVEVEGLTGPVRFDQWGIRHDFWLDLVELQREGLVRVGSWQDTLGLQVDNILSTCLISLSFHHYRDMILQVARLQSRAKLEPRETIENKTIVVTTVKSPPYAMFK